MRMIAALERVRPRGILLTDQGVDIPFAIEHPELSEYMSRNYVVERTFGDLKILLRRNL